MVIKNTHTHHILIVKVVFMFALIQLASIANVCKVELQAMTCNSTVMPKWRRCGVFISHEAEWTWNIKH